MKPFHPLWFVALVLAFLGLDPQAHAQQIPPIRILPLGDSITAGWGGDANQGGYRNPLYLSLTATGYNVNFVGTSNENSGTMVQPWHEGHSGWHISGIASNIAAWLASVDNPDVVLMHIGTNDFGSGDNITTAIDRLDGLITQIATLRPYAHIIVTNLMERDEPYNTQIQTLFNPYVQARVNAQAALGRRVTFLDMRSVMPLADTVDSLHPNQTGYNLMANAWLSAIQAVCGPLGDSLPPGIASAVGATDHTHVSITFSKPVVDSAATVSNFAINGGLTISAASLDASKRVVTLTTSPQTVGTTYTATVNGVVDRTAAANPLAANSTVSFQPGIVRGYANNITESSDYTLVYSLDITDVSNFSTTVPYTVDTHAGAVPFSRVAYYLELQAPGGTLQYVWASMNAFTNDAGKIGVPSAASGAVFQQGVSALNVVSNVAGVVTGTGLSGNLEFWPTNYNAVNSAGVPGASDSLLDFGDTNVLSGLYGSMQIHNPAAAQTILAFNDWGGYGSTGDIGIGNNPASGGSPDWTFAGNANGYSVKTLQVMILPGSIWTNLAGGSWAAGSNWASGSIPNGAGVNVDFSALDLTGDTTVTLDGAVTVGSLIFGDTTPDHNWILASGSGGSLIMNDNSGVPSITVNNQTATISAAIADNNGLTKSGSGTLALANTSDAIYGNIAVNGGVLDITAGQLYNGNGGSWVLTVNTGSTLRLNTFGQGWSGQNLGMLSTVPSSLVVNGGTIEMANPNYSFDTRNFTVGNLGATLSVSQASGTWLLYAGAGALANNSSLTLTGSGNGEFDMPITGSGTLVKSGSGSWSLTGMNTYTGATHINAGMLQVTGANATLGSNSAVILANVAGAKLQSFWWNGVTNIGTNFSIGSLSGGGATGGNVVLGQTSTLTMGTDNTSTTYAGVISDIWGSAGINKTGTGTLTLTGTGIYSGTTTVSQGTLQLLGALPSGGPVIVGPAGTLAGTGTISGPVTVNGTLAPGTAAPGLLTLSNALILTGTVTMRIGKTGSNLVYDSVTGISSLTCGGAIIVTNPTGAAFTAGDTFRLFTAGYYTGAFSSIVLPLLPAGLTWDATNLAYTGIISVNTPVVGILPAGWTGTDIGAVGIPGGSTYNGVTYGVNGSGGDIGGTADAFQFSAQTLTGDGEIRARIPSQTDNTNALAKAGVMMRDGTGAGAVNVFVALTPVGFTFQSRASVDGPTTTSGTASHNVSPNNWVRLLRVGMTVTAFVSADGITWIQIGTGTLASASVSIGLAVTSRDNSAIGTAAFDNVAVLSWAPSTAVKPAIDSSLLINPGKGYVEYWGPTSAYTNDVIGIGYNRCSWSTLEPSEGVYDWSWVDNYLAAYASYGRKFAFGVINVDPGCTPAWVFQSGTNADTGTVYPAGAASRTISAGYVVPTSWDDPVYLARMKEFIAAFGKRYNGNPNIAYLDIRDYGVDGEGNGSEFGCTDVSPDSYKNNFYLPYFQAFPNTQIIVNGMDWLFGDVIAWGVAQGAGRRTDGICSGSGNGSNCLICYPYHPAVMEYWGLPTSVYRGGNENELLTYVRGGRPSYLQFNGDGLYESDKPFYQMIGNLIGYHFILQEADVPNAIQAGVPFQLNFNWLNDGVAPLYEPCSVAVALLDTNNNVVQKQWLAGSNTNAWMPDVTTAETFTVTFPAVPSGYKLALGLFLSKSDANPAYKLAMQGRVNNGWYLLTGSANLVAAKWTNAAGGSWAGSNWSGNNTVNGTDVIADFSTLNLTANATVTLDGAVTVGDLIFGDTTPSHNWILNAGTGGLLTMKVGSGAPAPCITVNNQTLTLNASLTGNQGLTKSGSGTLILAGINSYLGNTIINGGVLEIASNSKLYTVFQGATVTVNAGATLRVNGWGGYGNGGWGELDQLPTDNPNAVLLNGGTLEFASAPNGNSTSDRAFAIGTAGATLKNSSGVSWTLAASGTTTQATVTNNSSLTLDGTGLGGTLQKGILGMGSLTKIGTGTWTIFGADTYSGATTVSAGTLVISGSVTNTSAVNVAAGAEIDVSGQLNATGNIINSGTLVFSGAAQFSAGGTITNNGTIINTSSSLMLPAIVNNGTITSVLPPPWAKADVGNPTLTGTSIYKGGDTFVVKGAGGGIAGSSDAFQFAYETTTQTSFSVIARVTAPATGSTQVGLMIRNGTAVGAKMAAMILKSNGTSYQAQFGYRSSTNGAITWANGTSGLAAPQWLKITRAGTAFTGYVLGSDGVTWNQVGTRTINSVTTAYCGLAVSSSNTGVLATGTFDNVSVLGWSMPPSGLTATAASQTQINLGWNSLSGATGYQVMRSGSWGGTYSQIGTSAVTSYSDTGLSAGTAYYYMVRATTSASGTSANSDVAAGTTLAAVPTGLSATGSNGVVTLNWAASSGAASYNVKRSLTSGSGYASAVTGVTGTSNADTGLTNGTTYYYVVSAVDAGGESGNSTETAVNPVAPPAITSATGAAGMAGSGFSYQITAGNSPTGFGASGLPSWLTVSSSTGLMGGIPAAAGSYKLTVSANNAAGTGSAPLTITVLPQPPVIGSSASAAGTSGSGFSYLILASGNPTNFAADGLPSGLSVNPSTGLISGTPTMTGTTTVALSAINSGGTGSAMLTITVLPPRPAAPAGLAAAGSNAQVALSWNASPWASSYNVKRSLTSGSGYSTLINTATASYSDTSVVNGTTYYYVVSALNAAGESTNSVQAGAKPFAPVAAGELKGPAIAISGQTAQLTVPSVYGRIYQLQRTDSLNPSSWTNIGDSQIGTGGVLILSDSNATLLSRRFYRIQIQP
jgi:autotransporter-associated beta strand protein